MPVQPTYPGVYIEEIPSGVRTITGVSTSIAAFIDYFKRGPMNKAVQVFNFGDFERAFGGLDALSEASYAIQQFFLNGGSQAYVVRVAGGDPAPASVEITDNSLAAPSALSIEAGQEGTWGNSVRIKIDYNATGQDVFNMVISEFNAAGTTPLRQEIFRNLTLANGSSRNITTVINDADTGSKIIRVANETDALPVANGTVSGEHTDVDAEGQPAVEITSADSTFEISFDTLNGTFTQEVDLSLPALSGGETHYKLSVVAALLEDAIRSASPANPLFAKCSVQLIGNRLLVLSGPGAPDCIVTLQEVAGNTIIGELLLSSGGGAVANIQEYCLGNAGMDGRGAQLVAIPGDDGVPADSAALIGSLNNKTGIFALEDVDLFNILCIPRTGMTTGDNAITPTGADAVISTAQSYCESKRAMLILDTPIGISDLAGIKDWMAAKATLRTKNTALYYPRVLIPDPLNEFRLRSVGACGTIAGLYARTDSNRGVWKAPAGTEAGLRNVSKLSDVLSDQENGVLNPLGVNCLRNFPVYGNVSWGARTLEGADAMASEWKYVPVRRLALFLEESLFRGTQWVVFEPNDEPLWAQIRLNIGAFMNNLFKQGAFQGTSPRDAYLVKCDRETTTQNDINLGIVNILVGFAPLKPAEFVIIKIQQLAGQIQS